MKIAIVGSRDYQHLDRVRIYVESLSPDTIIVSGGARGVDKTAEITAKRCGLKTIMPTGSQMGYLIVAQA